MPFLHQSPCLSRGEGIKNVSLTGMYERSSVVEHVLHTDGVVGSIPIVRTNS